MKKDHTYDHKGNVLEIKNIKTDYLPSIAFSSTKVRLNGN